TTARTAWASAKGRRARCVTILRWRTRLTRSRRVASTPRLVTTDSANERNAVQAGAPRGAPVFHLLVSAEGRAIPREMGPLPARGGHWADAGARDFYSRTAPVADVSVR